MKNQIEQLGQEGGCGDARKGGGVGEGVIVG